MALRSRRWDQIDRRSSRRRSVRDGKFRFEGSETGIWAGGVDGEDILGD